MLVSINEEVRAYCKQSLAHYKVPRYIKFVSEFPTTVSGKIQKFKMREQMCQELKLEESLEEYVKGAMLIEMLKASGKLALQPGSGDTIYDLSVGYDLAGISSPPVRGFLAGLMDASAVVERLRAQIPPALARFRDLPFRTRISDTLTLSTFHGCPADEIEGIAGFLLGEALPV